jgi:hypothetical protein
MTLNTSTPQLSSEPWYSSWHNLTDEERLAAIGPLEITPCDPAIVARYDVLQRRTAKRAQVRWAVPDIAAEAHHAREEARFLLTRATEGDDDDALDAAQSEFDQRDEALDFILATHMRSQSWKDRVRERMEKDRAKVTGPADITPSPVLIAANDNQPWLTASALLDMHFEPVNYVVPGFIAEGLTILGGRPKLGKSWLALDFGVAVASGGMSLGARCAKGSALYLALEDNDRRLQDRLRTVLPKMRSAWPDLSNLALVTTAPKVGAGLVQALDTWRTSVLDPRLIIIDTLAMVRPPKKGNQDSYSADYEVLSPLQRYASEHRIAVVVVTHVRKMEASDPLEMISGTNGLTGAADSIMVLDRTADGPKLYGRGRDIEEVEKALKFDAGKWSVIGDLAEVKRSDQRRDIIEVMTDHRLPMKPSEISKELGVPVANVTYLVRKMVEAGELEKAAYGSYILPSESSDPSELFDSEDS